MPRHPATDEVCGAWISQRDSCRSSETPAAAHHGVAVMRRYNATALHHYRAEPYLSATSSSLTFSAPAGEREAFEGEVPPSIGCRDLHQRRASLGVAKTSGKLRRRSTRVVIGANVAPSRAAFQPSPCLPSTPLSRARWSRSAQPYSPDSNSAFLNFSTLQFSFTAR